MKGWWIFLLLLFILPIQIQAANEELSRIAPLLLKNEQIGLLLSEGLEKQYGLVNDQTLLQKVQRIGQQIVSATDHPEAKYDFGILSSNLFNATSIYGGRIRVFRGLINDTRHSDSELAAVLAHEIAHNELGHNREVVKTFKLASILELTGIEKKTPQLLMLAANAALAKRNRKFEVEADQKALEWMDKAGFSPTGAIAVFRRIEAEHKLEEKRTGKNVIERRFAQIFVTHPEPSSRVAVAEDFLFEKKYGQTFKLVLASSTSDKKLSKPPGKSIAGDLPIIVAHPSLWESPLAIPGNISGVGIFNPSPRSNEKKDVDFYLGILRQGQFVCVIYDNDFHGLDGGGAHQDYTFVCSPILDQNRLLQAIREGRTYASRDGTEIQNENFPIGPDYPKVRAAILKFRFAFPKQVSSAPKITIYRNGEKISELKTISGGKQFIQAEYILDDSKLKAGSYWYVLYVPGNLITSPITLEVTNNGNDPMDYPSSSDWHKGVIHYHSDHSDGHSTLRTIWEEGRNCGVEFIFMTDHANHFGKTNSYDSYVRECHDLSSLGWPIPVMVPGVEFPLTQTSFSRHLLVLGLDTYLPYKPLNEEEFFGEQVPDKTLILKGPVHLGDDQKDSEIHKDAVFDYSPADATLKLRIKGTPRKDPIIWINRKEVGRVITTDDKWHTYDFKVPKSFLKAGRNLFHIQSFIPDRWQTFDDCEVADIWLHAAK